MKFLKTVKQLTPQASLKYWLHDHLSEAEDARPLSRIHASELTKAEGFCPRFYALADVTKYKPKPQWVTASEQVTFHIGRVLQDSVVNWFADMGKAVCHWKCQSCGRLHEFQVRPYKCQACQHPRFTPIEVRFESAVSGASCGVDMLVAMGETKLRPVELKTIDKEQFKDLKAPLAEHRWRTSLYLRIIAECEHSWSNLVSCEKATVLYISKGGYGCADPQLKAWGLSDKFSPFKEYEIKRADAETNDLVRRARAVKLFRSGEAGMPCGICKTALEKRATSCPLRGACFSGDWPYANDWTKEGSG